MHIFTEEPVGAERSSPLLQGVMKLLWVPTEFPLDQQVHGAGVVTVVLQDELLPWKAEEVLNGRQKPSKTKVGSSTFGLFLQ